MLSAAEASLTSAAAGVGCVMLSAAEASLTKRSQQWDAPRRDSSTPLRSARNDTPRGARARQRPPYGTSVPGSADQTQ